MASTGKAIFLDKTATEKLILQSQEENRGLLTELLNNKAKFIKEETIEEGKKLFALKDEIVAGGVETVVLPDGFYESVESNNGKLTNEQLAYFSFDEYKIYLMRFPLDGYIVDVYLAPSLKIDDVKEGKTLGLVNDGFGLQVSINFNKKTFNVEIRNSYDDSELRERIEEAEYNIAGLSDYVYNLSHFRIEVVNNVSQVTETNVFYLIKDSNATGADVYEEWILVNGTPTLIGDTSIDLSNYVSIDYAKENLVEMVEIPQSLVIKLLTAYNAGGDSFELTDNELAIFENYENKKYVAISPENNAISVVFTPSLRGLMDEDSLILYSGEFFMVQISFNTKTGRAGRTINSQDYDYLQRRVKEAEEDIEKINTNLDTKVEIVNVPQDLIVKLLGVAQGTNVSLTDEEMTLFENAHSKMYYINFQLETILEIVYRYKTTTLIGTNEVIVLESEINAIWVDKTNKQAQVVKTLVDLDLEEIETKADNNATEISNLQGTIGNIDEILDEINGGGTTSGGGSATVKSLTIEFNFLDETEWQYDAEAYTMTCLSDEKSTEIANFINTIGPKNPINFHMFPYVEEGDLYVGFTSTSCIFQCFCGYSEGVPATLYLGMGIMIGDMSLSIATTALGGDTTISSQVISEFTGKKMILTAYYID